MKDGGPAYPSNKELCDGSYEYFSGLSIRDWFAGQCLAMLADPTLQGSEDKDLQRYANYCYRMADAMLAERTKPCL